MYCGRCGTRNDDNAKVCSRCGSAIVQPLPPLRRDPFPTQRPVERPPLPGELHEADLATFPQRISSFVLDVVLQSIPYLGIVPAIFSLFLGRRGQTVGLMVVRARVVRENGDVAGFYHTAIRNLAWSLSLLALGLGLVWATWDPKRQTWHDKLMKTYVLRDTQELATTRPVSNARWAMPLFWFLLALAITASILAYHFFGPQMDRLFNMGKA